MRPTEAQYIFAAPLPNLNDEGIGETIGYLNRRLVSHLYQGVEWKRYAKMLHTYAQIVGGESLLQQRIVAAARLNRGVRDPQGGELFYNAAITP